jgi:hypothetical protein
LESVSTYQRLLTVRKAREWSESGQLYAILDACDTPSVPDKAKELGETRAVSLYRGQAEEQLEAIAPYLVSVDAQLFDWITGTLWSEPWGILVRSKGDLQSLRLHFRRLLFVESPTGEEWYFRYYDPRVLEKYLRTCTQEELASFFGPVTMFCVTDEQTYGVKAISREPFLPN